MTLNKIQAFFVGFAIILSPFLLYKISWLVRSEKTNAIVIGVHEVHSSRMPVQYAPVYEFAVSGQTYEVNGNYNLPFHRDEVVPIRYLKDNPDNVLWDSFLGIWIDMILYSGVPLLVWIMVFLHPGIFPKGSYFIFSQKGIHLRKPADYFE